MIMLFLFEHLRAKLQGLELIRVVIKVNGSCRLLQEVRTLDSNLGVVRYAILIFNLIQAGFRQFIDAVVLIRLVLLRQNDLLKARWLCF